MRHRGKGSKARDEASRRARDGTLGTLEGFQTSHGRPGEGKNPPSVRVLADLGPRSHNLLAPACASASGWPLTASPSPPHSRRFPILTPTGRAAERQPRRSRLWWSPESTVRAGSLHRTRPRSRGPAPLGTISGVSAPIRSGRTDPERQRRCDGRVITNLPIGVCAETRSTVYVLFARLGGATW